MKKPSIHSSDHPAVQASRRRAGAAPKPKTISFEFRAKIAAVGGSKISLAGDSKDGLPTQIPLRLLKANQQAQARAGAHIKITMENGRAKSAELV